MRLLVVSIFCGACFAAAPPRIIPAPQHMEPRPGSFLLDESVRILLPEKPSSEDGLLANLLTAELSDWHNLAVPSRKPSPGAKGERVIVMGAIANPVVKQYCAKLGLAVTAKDPGPEGYVLDVTPNVVLVAGSDERGAFYGLQSLRQLIAKAGSRLEVPGTRIRDWPHKPFRGFRLYVPGREDIPFFKKMVRDVLALYKYNTLILEMSGAMRFSRHPEVNAGWIDFAKDLNYSRRDRPTGPHREFMDSGNHDNGDGRVLEKDEVAELVRWARQFHMEVIPEIPSLTHSYYLLTRHRELAEMRDWEWPDSYCPSNPKSYELLFDVLDEYVEVMKPPIVHIGHDEWRIEVGACPRCRGKNPTDLYAEDVNRIHAHLAKRGVRTALWGDHLVEAVRGTGTSDQKTPTGYRYKWPGALSRAQVMERIPKDILIFNWFWSNSRTSGEETASQRQGEKNTLLLEELGFQQVFGNLEPQIENWGPRSVRKGILGGAPSSWAITSELAIGKDLMLDLIGCAGLVWSKAWPRPLELQTIVQQAMPAVRRYFAGRSAPSDDGDPIEPIAIGDGVTIPVGADPSSLIFQHACARPGRNDRSYRYVYNVDDTADLLGHYEIVYEDGFVATVPIRYGVNILEADWPRGNPRSYCYACDPVQRGAATSFTYEWRNPRFGKIVKEVRLRPSSGVRGTSGRPIADNAVTLYGLSQVRKRPFPEPVSAR